MKKSVLSTLFIVISSFFIVNCVNSQTSEFKLEDMGKKENIVQEITVDDINTIIEQSDFSLLFFFTTWCLGSHENLKGDLKNILDTLDTGDDKLSIAIIGLAKSKNEIEEMVQKYEINYVTYYLNSPVGSGMDKVKINKTLKNTVKGYSSVNFVPVSVLCDKQHKIISEPTSSFKYNESYYRVYLKNNTKSDK